MQNIWIAEP